MIRKFFVRGMAVLILVNVAVAAGTLGFWVTDRKAPTTIDGTQVLTPIVSPGGILEVKRRVWRSEICYTTISRILTDSEGRRFNLGLIAFPNGNGRLGYDEYIVNVSVPLTMSEGEAKFLDLACYQCNPIHMIWPVCAAPREEMFKVAGKAVSKLYSNQFYQVE